MFYLAVNNFYFYFSVQVQTDQRKSTHQGGVGNYFGDPHAPLTRPKKLVDEQMERTNKLVQQWQQQQQQQQQTTTVD